MQFNLEENVIVLYLIRHGQSWNNALEDRLKDRVPEPPLSEAGQEQAELVGVYLKNTPDKANRGAHIVGHGITQLYCSAMLRTLQTTVPIAHALELTPKIWIDVHEGGGVWFDEGDGKEPVGFPGLKRSEIEAQFLGFLLPEGITEAGWWGPHKETPAEQRERAQRVAKIIGERFFDTEERVAIASHGGFISSLLCALLGDLDGISFDNHNTAINRLDFVDGRLEVCYLNRVDHLPPELIT